MKERTQPCTVQHIYKYVKIIDFYKTEFLNDSMLFTITQIEGNKDVLERSHYINWPGDTEADVSDKFSFPVLFSSLGTWYIFQINFHASFHEAVGKVSFFSLSRLKLFFPSNRVYWNNGLSFPTFYFFIISLLLSLMK